ncbi:MAG: hypothetical protein DHS20C16_29020 [Phycisphaerae bacterium]|nr:MAG: hypothetical protein DHS20C16_29020 [Phycisphaerae bacterium]
METRANRNIKPRAFGAIGIVVFGACIVALWGNLQPVDQLTTDHSPRGHSKKNARIQWGIYQINWGSDRFEHFLDLTIEKLASSPDYVMFYRDLRCPFPARAVKIIRERGGVPSISLELWHWGRGETKYLSMINAGEFDDFFESWARDAKAEGGPVLLRFGFEFNGDWFSWSGDPEEYVAAWRRAHGIFKRIGADNVQWVWAPNITSVPESPANDMHLYYPGDAYVDWVGVDGYNWGDHHDEWHTWQSCQAIFEKVLADFDRRYPKHPVMLAEFGSVEDTPGRKGKWITDAMAWLSEKTRVSAVIWFNLDKRREGEQDWRIDSSAESLEAFNRSFANPN